MKNTIIPLLLISTLFTITFGVATMSHTDEMGHSLCPFEAVGVTNCAQVQNSLNFLISHLNALSHFFLANPINGFSGLIALLALAVLLTFNKSAPPNLKPVFIKNRFRESFVPPQRSVFTDWFALHENSPAFILGR